MKRTVSFPHMRRLNWERSSCQDVIDRRERYDASHPLHPSKQIVESAEKRKAQAENLIVIWSLIGRIPSWRQRGILKETRAFFAA